MMDDEGVFVVGSLERVKAATNAGQGSMPSARRRQHKLQYPFTQIHAVKRAPVPLSFYPQTWQQNPSQNAG
jgi:hypothetical protein